MKNPPDKITIFILTSISSLFFIFGIIFLLIFGIEDLLALFIITFFFLLGGAMFSLLIYVEFWSRPIEVDIGDAITFHYKQGPDIIMQFDKIVELNIACLSRKTKYKTATSGAIKFTGQKKYYQLSGEVASEIRKKYFELFGRYPPSAP